MSVKGYNNHQNHYRRKKMYRARLDESPSHIVGWPKFYHEHEKRTVWQAIRAMLF